MSESARRDRFGLALFSGALLASLALSGCVTHHHHHGPRAHAAAATVAHTETRVVTVPVTASHGHVHHRYDHGVSLVFDSAWGGYWVRDLPNHYYRAGLYFRWHADRWHQSRHPRGPWVVIGASKLPRTLDRHHARIAHSEAKQAWKETKREVAEERREQKREIKAEPRETKQRTVTEHRQGEQGRKHEKRQAKAGRKVKKQEDAVPADQAD